MTQLLRARGIRQQFGERVVLDGVDLDVPSGRVIGLLGPNGAGKTTLMRILFGVIEPDAGEVTWEDRAATPEDRRSWGYMPQERGLYPDIRVIDLLVWIARLHGLDRATSRANSERLLEQLGLGDRGHDDVKDLSGGMAQHVQLAAAMVHEPDLLVLDEPFAGLDPVAIEFLSNVVREHVAAGRNVLFSSHQLDLVEDLCDTITLIHRGEVVLQGDVRQLKANSAERYLRVGVNVEPRGCQRSRSRSRAPTRPGLVCSWSPESTRPRCSTAIRAHVRVEDFAVEAPTLSELFLAAAGESVHTVEDETPERWEESA